MDEIPTPDLTVIFQTDVLNDFKRDYILVKTENRLMELMRQVKAELREQLKIVRYYGIDRHVISKGLYSIPEICGINTRKTYQVASSLYQNFLENFKIKQQGLIGNYQARMNRSRELTPIVFITFTIPRIDSTSSERRLIHILKILAKNNYKIQLVYCKENFFDNKLFKKFGGKIKFEHLPFKIDDYEKFILKKNPSFIWITELWRLNYIKNMVSLSARLKFSNTKIPLLIDTVDFHYKEFYRKYEVTKNNNDLKKAKKILKYEKKLYKIADTIITVSEEEKTSIEKYIPNINSIEVIPNIHIPKEDKLPFKKRKNICFVGHFGNAHNVDAVRMFLKNIWPIITNNDKNIFFHIIGINSEAYRKEFRGKNVKVIGRLKYLNQALLNYKLFVCPMTYGTGMKGKIGEAIAAGVPIVTTSIGAEGFPLKDNEAWFIADDPLEFAEKCILCLNNRILWDKFSKKSAEQLQTNFGIETTTNRLINLLSKVKI